MGRYFTLTLNIPHQKEKARPKATALLPNVSLWVVVLLIFFGIIYLLIVNSLSTTGYQIKNLEQKLLELKEANKRLELEAAALKSIQSLEQEVRGLNLVPSGAIKYIGEKKDYVYRQ